MFNACHYVDLPCGCYAEVEVIETRGDGIVGTVCTRTYDQHCNRTHAKDKAAEDSIAKQAEAILLDRLRREYRVDELRISPAARGLTL